MKFVPVPLTVQSYGRSYQSFVVKMRPQDFLDAAYRQVQEDEDEAIRLGMNVHRMPSRYDFAETDPLVGAQLAYNIEHELPIDVPHLFVQDAAETVCTGYELRRESCKIKLTGHGRVSEHEGRNRAAVSEALGIKSIPVRIDVQGLKDWYENQKIYKEPAIQKALLKNIGLKTLG